MKIKSIEPIVLKIPFSAGADNVGFGDKPWTSYDMLVVRVESDSGIVGWGEAWGYGIIPATKATIEHVVAAHFIGREIAGFATLLSELRYKLHLFGRNGTVNYALSGIEIALWDIWGKATGMALHQLLGGAHRLTFNSYASLLPYKGSRTCRPHRSRRRCQGLRRDQTARDRARGRLQRRGPPWASM
jgi:L-alanine-DL-glutamate epimerase-like enolase superfamily enzyme